MCLVGVEMTHGTGRSRSIPRRIVKVGPGQLWIRSLHTHEVWPGPFMHTNFAKS